MRVITPRELLSTFEYYSDAITLIQKVLYNVGVSSIVNPRAFMIR